MTSFARSGSALTHICVNGRWRAIWSEWKAAIIIVLISIAGLCVHGFVLEKLVGLRTRELKEAWKKQQETECEAREASARLESLQRAGAVGRFPPLWRMR